MVIPQTFGRTGERIIASYNYADIADGTGVSVFYGVQSEASGGDEYFLTSSSDYGGTTLFMSGAQNLDLTTFNLPRTAKGVATLSCTTKVASGTPGVSAKLQHVRGAVVTDISSTISSKGSSIELKFLLRIPITEKLFKKGDILRLLLTGSASASGIWMTAAKPIKLNMPFKINL